MTLPPNSLPQENASLAGDLLAVLGQPATPAPDAQPDAPFSDLLASASPAQSQSPVQAQAPLPVCAQPPVVAVPVAQPALLYPGNCYSTLVQVRDVAGPVVEDVTGIAAGETEDSEPDAVPEDAREVIPEGDEAEVIAYQLIANNWVQQPAPPQTKAPADDSDADLPADGIADAAQRRHPVVGIEEPRVAQRAIPVASDREHLPVVATATPALTTASSNTEVRREPASASLQNADQTATAKSDGDAAVAATNGFTMPESLSAKTENARSVKIAAPAIQSPAEIASGVNTSKQFAEKKILNVDDKSLKSMRAGVGTDTANRGFPMSSAAPNKSGAPTIEAPTQASSVGGMQSAPAAMADQKTPEAVHVQASRLVEEVRTIADRIASVDRNSVEVRFDFNESDRLSVRVEYRDGTVHTTFRTDSDALRSVIAREWQTQSVSAETRSYRIAEPVFSSNNTSASADLSNSGSGSGQPHGRAFEQHPASSHPAFAGHARQSGGSPAMSGSPATGFRPETSRLLHTFA